MDKHPKTVNLNELDNFIGEVLISPVTYGGFTLVSPGEVLTESLVTKLKGLGEGLSSIKIVSYGEVVKEDSKILSELYPKVKTIMESYSFDGEEDINTVAEVMESIISNIQRENNLGSLQLDKLLLDKPDLCAHSLNVAVISALLAIKSGRFQRWMIEQVTLGALLHDIGLAKLMDLKGVKTVTELEVDDYSEHPCVGYELLEENIYIPDSIRKIVLMHHMWNKPEVSWNANDKSMRSFPQVYKGRKLLPDSKSLSVSIVQTADAYEHMVTVEGKNRRKAINIILSNAEKVYGEGAVLLSSYVSPFVVGEVVTLSNKKEAKVISHTSSPLRPVVQLLGKKDLINLQKRPFLKILQEG